MCEPDIVQDEITKIITDTTPYETTTKGLGYEIFNAMKLNKDKVAQYITDTGHADTYNSFLQRATRSALYLKERNFTSEDVVCCSSYNQLHSAVPVLACFFLGIPVASLDPSFTESEATHAIKLVKPKIFFIVPEVLDLIQNSIKTLKIKAEIVVYYDDKEDPTGNITNFNNFLKPHPDEELFAPVEIDDINQTAAIFFSSGTTGLPKGICINHKTLFHQAVLLSSTGHYTKDIVSYLFTTLYWISGVLHLTGCILNGGAKVLSKSQEVDPNEIWKNIAKYKVNYSLLVPPRVYSMIASGRPEGTDTTSFNVALIGGCQCSPEKLYEFRSLLPGTLVFQSYGCTEVAGRALVFNLYKTKDRLLLKERPKSVGRPLPGYRYRVVDLDTGANLGPNKYGELRISSEFATTGYYEQDSSTAFDSNGWLRTGDIVYYDEDYCFYIVDRIKEMLKYRSWRVPPALIEGVIYNHPAVNQCMVIGIPDEIDGDLPCAIIVLNKNHQKNVKGEQIQEYVAERVNDTHKLRGGVKFIKDFPLTPSGKVNRKQVRDMMLNGEI